MDGAVVRNQVKVFRERTAQQAQTEHSFAPWYLHHEHQLPETTALQQVSDGNYDFGIDAFHLVTADSAPVLILIQAKFSDKLQTISHAFADLTRSLPEVVRALEGSGADVPIQNKVLVNMRAALNRLDSESKEKLRIEFAVLHLSEEDPVVFSQRMRSPKDKLRDGIERFFDDRVCLIRSIGPAELGPPVDRYVPPEKNFLALDATEPFVAGDGCRMLLGIGRLGDLVELYKSRRDHLFSRNVRYYLYKKQNVEKGPAGKMRETLKQICLKNTQDPELFALFHNGITVHASHVERTDGGVLVRDPYVLNGCQTIKNAFFFRNDPTFRDRIDVERWKRVSLPIRVIETKDAELVRTITVNNNRQNAIGFAALRSNDPVQIRLEERFKERGIFYERQEGAYANLEGTSPEMLDEEYDNTRGRSVTIVDLARALASAAGEIRLADRPKDLFESDVAYKRCFNEKTRIQSATLLIFLQNVHDILGTILKKDLDLIYNGSGPRPLRLKYYTICLLLRYLAKRKAYDFVIEHGRQLLGRDTAFRKDVVKKLRSRDSGIRAALARDFMKLQSADAKSMKDAFEQTQDSLKLKDIIDPFVRFSGLDDRAGTWE